MTIRLMKLGALYLVQGTDNKGRLWTFAVYYERTPAVRLARSLRKDWAKVK